MKTQFSGADEDCTSDDSTALVDTYNKILSELLDKHAPETTTTWRTRKSDVCFDNDYRQMKKEIRCCERCYKLVRLGANRECYNLVRLGANRECYKLVRLGANRECYKLVRLGAKREISLTAQNNYRKTVHQKK